MYTRSTAVLHRNAISSNDAAMPSSISGVKVAHYDKLILEIKIGGTSTPTWTITPGYWSIELAAYCNGGAIVVSSGASGGNVIVELDTLGAEDVYIMCSGSSGTLPTITIYGIGANQRF